MRGWFPKSMLSNLSQEENFGLLPLDQSIQEEH